MKQLFLIVSFALLAFAASAQEAIKADAVTVRIDDKVYLIRVAENDRIRNVSANTDPPYRDGFRAETTEMTCELLFRASAIKKSGGEVLVTLYIATRDGKKSSSFDKRIAVKKGEEKNLKLSSKLKCMYDKQYSVSVGY